MDSTPEISVIIPVFNREESISHTLNTIQHQTFTHWECLLVDDQSTDGVQEICRAYASQDPRFKCLENLRKKGAPGARNTGILSARSPYVLLFDSDNFLHPDALEKLLHAMRGNVTDIVTCFAAVIDSKGNQVSRFHWKCSKIMRKDLLTGKSYVDNNLALIRRSLFDITGLTDEDCPSYQEWDTHIRLSEHARYFTVEEELVDYVRGDKDTISGDPVKSVRGFSYVLKKHSGLFGAYPVEFHQLGSQLYEMVLATQNPDLRAEIHSELITLLPDFDTYRKKEKRQARLNGFKHRIKRIFRKD